ncbi:MAG TPA: hypothetical protein ENK77_02195 [Epsilonproteobacteria bacterium]|nr:hypothetical protein [Campylobacterota bacterium]
MLKKFRRKLNKMFREFLVYHNSSLEFRAKLITLMIASDIQMSECEERVLRETAHKIYENNTERAEVLIDTVKEYFEKIKTKNGLDYEHLIILVQREVREVKRFHDKIEIDLLRPFIDCQEDEDEKIFSERVIEFLEELKQEHGAV